MAQHNADVPMRNYALITGSELNQVRKLQVKESAGVKWQRETDQSHQLEESGHLAY